MNKSAPQTCPRLVSESVLRPIAHKMTSTEEIATMDNAEAAAAAAAKRGTAKRDALRAHERAIQAEWETARVYQSDATSNTESFLVTFPYPYMNGVLHIGHAFSLTKAVFRAQYERHLGKNVLFPFAFHCTGMPIQAVRYFVYEQCDCLVFLFSMISHK
jgi:tRNA synthetases class I (I, L, M and V)